MDTTSGKLYAVWGNTPQMKKRKMYLVFNMTLPSGNEVPYGYIKSSKGKITYNGELYSIIERDQNWKVIQVSIMPNEKLKKNSSFKEEIDHDKEVLIELAFNDAKRYRGSHSKNQPNNNEQLTIINTF